MQLYAWTGARAASAWPVTIETCDMFVPFLLGGPRSDVLTANLVFESQSEKIPPLPRIEPPTLPWLIYFALLVHHHPRTPKDIASP